MADLVGQHGELDAIAALIAAARSGRGGLLTVWVRRGQADQRSSSTPQTRARGADVRVLAARATQLDQESGLGLLRRVLLPLVEADPDLLVGGPAAWAGPLFSPGTAEVDHLAVSQGLISGFGRAGEGRGLLAIVLDDLHLADRASVRVLAEEVARATPDLPLALVVSVVEGRWGAGWRAWSPSGRPPDRPSRPCGGRRASSERLGGVLTEDLLIALESDTGGLPAVLVPVLAGLSTAWRRCPCAVDRGCRAGRTAGPSGQGRRAPRRGDAEARMLTLAAVAVLGADARIDVVAAAVGLDPTQVAPLVAELVDAGLFEPGVRLAWTLPLLARAALDLLPSGRRGLVAVGAARAMAGAGDPRTRSPRSSSARRSWASPGRRLHWLRQPPKPSGEGHRRSPRTCGSASSTNPWTRSAVGGPPPRWPERSCTWGIRPVQLASMIWRRWSTIPGCAHTFDSPLPGRSCGTRRPIVRRLASGRRQPMPGSPGRRRSPAGPRGAPRERDRRPRRRSGCPARRSATGERWHR